MMRQQLWTAIITTSAAIERLVVSLGERRESASTAADTPSMAVAAPTRTRPPRLETTWRNLAPEAREPAATGSLRVIDDAGETGRDGLGALQQQVRAQLDGLWSQLADVHGFAAIQRALLIYFDERIMSTLPEQQRLSWPLLQTQHTGSRAGGEDFYRFVDAALDDPKTPSLVFEVDYFCLRHGFRGRYAHNPAKIEAYEQRLLARIEVPPAAVSRREATDGDAPPRPWPPWLYYVLALLLVVGACVLATALSNIEPGRDDDERERRTP